jgi:hypothetical protein
VLTGLTGGDELGGQISALRLLKNVVDALNLRSLNLFAGKGVPESAMWHPRSASKLGH